MDRRPKLPPTNGSRLFLNSLNLLHPSHAATAVTQSFKLNKSKKWIGSSALDGLPPHYPASITRQLRVLHPVCTSSLAARRRETRRDMRSSIRYLLLQRRSLTIIHIVLSMNVRSEGARAGAARVRIRALRAVIAL